MGLAFKASSRDSGIEYDETVEIDRTEEIFLRKMRRIKRFVKNVEKIKENVSLKYFYITDDDDISEKLYKGTKQDKRNFISGNYFLDKEEAKEFLDTGRYRYRFWMADEDADKRMARIEKKIQKINDENL